MSIDIKRCLKLYYEQKKKERELAKKLARILKKHAKEKRKDRRNT